MDPISKKQEYWYIAAPFFNLQQVIAVKQIEEALIATKRDFFTPRLSIVSVQARRDGMTEILAKQIFDVNLDALNVRCNRIVAFFGWELPEDRVIYEVGIESTDVTSISNGPESKSQITKVVDPFKGPLNLPDSGTVWEVGYSFASGIPIFGIFGKNQVPNLMLTQSCAATFKNVASFGQWLKAYDSDSKLTLPCWRGPQQ